MLDYGDFDCVVYIHRTARDPIEQPKTWAKVLSWSKIEGNEPLESLLAASLLEVKPIRHSIDDLDIPRDNITSLDHLYNTVTKAFSILEKCSVNQSWKSYIDVLDEVGKVMEVHWQTWAASAYHVRYPQSCVLPYAWTRYVIHDDYEYGPDPDFHDHNALLCLAVRHGLLEYVKAKTASNLKFLRKWHDRSLFDYACNAHRGFENEVLISYLLDCGVSLNEPSGVTKSTPCENALKRLQRNSIYGYSYGVLQDTFGAIFLLVTEIANLNAYCGSRAHESEAETYQSALHVIIKALKVKNISSTKYYDEAKEKLLELQQLLISKGAEDKVIFKEHWEEQRKLLVSVTPSEKRIEPAAVTAPSVETEAGPVAEKQFMVKTYFWKWYMKANLEEVVVGFLGKLTPL